MLDDFITRAVLAGVGVALVAGPLGCFIIWRRMAYFGDTMAHSALLGASIAILLGVNMVIGVFAVATLVALALLGMRVRLPLSSDSLLGILSHSALALGIVMVALLPSLRIDLLGVLFGDILAVRKADLLFIWGGGVLLIGMLCLIWRSLLAGTISPEIATAEGLHPNRAEFAFTLLLAAGIAIALEIVGVLLITAMLIIPAAAARRFARTPEMMAVAASVIGCCAVVLGLGGSLVFDTPSGPSIVLAALALFLVTLLGSFGLKKRARV